MMSRGKYPMVMVVIRIGNLKLRFDFFLFVQATCIWNSLFTSTSHLHTIASSSSSFLLKCSLIHEIKNKISFFFGRQGVDPVVGPGSYGKNGIVFI